GLSRLSGFGRRHGRPAALARGCRSLYLCIVAVPGMAQIEAVTGADLAGPMPTVIAASGEADSGLAKFVLLRKMAQPPSCVLRLGLPACAKTAARRLGRGLTMKARILIGLWLLAIFGLGAVAPSLAQTPANPDPWPREMTFPAG